MWGCSVTQSCPALCNSTDCAHQVLLSLEFSRKEYWSGLLLPPPENLPNPGIKPGSLASSALAGRFFATKPPGKPWKAHVTTWINLENMLRERSQAQKASCCMILFIRKTQDRYIYKNRKYISDCQWPEAGGIRKLLMGTGLLSEAVTVFWSWSWW